MKRSQDPANPLDRARRRAVVLISLCCLVTLVAAIWAFKPVQVEADLSAIQLKVDQERPRAEDTNSKHFDLEAFRLAKLWNPPTQLEPAPENEPKGQPPRNLRLVGIIEQNAERFAAIYDTTHNKLLIVKSGDTIHPYRVTAVGPASLTLAGDDQRLLEMRLRAEDES